MQRRGRPSAARALWSTYRDFAANTGMHGLKYVTEDGRRPLERVLWLVVVLCGLVGAGFMTASFWERFSTAPTRASVETNHYPVWRLPFPAVTLCNINRVFWSHVEKVFDALGAVGEEREEAKKALPMVMELVQPRPSFSNYNATLARIWNQLLERGNMTLLAAMAALDQDCTEMLERCMWEGDQVDCTTIFKERKSYLGMCCSFNYRGVTQVIDKNGREHLEMVNEEVRHSRFYSHRMGLSLLLNPMVYDYHLSTLHSAGIRMTVHRVDDYPDEAAEEKILPVGREVLVSVASTSSYCTEAVQALSPAARRCVFPGELKLRFFPVYSATNCLTECRMNYTASVCHCMPFYYNEDDEIRICNVNDIPCLTKYYYALRRRRAKNKKPAEGEAEGGVMSCECPPLCNQVDYAVHVSSGDFQASHYQRSPFLKDANVTGRSLLHLYQANYVTVRTKRDVVSSWCDLLSSLGGVFSLCLGFSAMSFIEVFYFFTLRLALRYRQLSAPSGVDSEEEGESGATAETRQVAAPPLFRQRLGVWQPERTTGISLWRNNY